MSDERICEACGQPPRPGREIFVMARRLIDPDRARMFCSWGCLNIWACGPTDNLRAEQEATS